MFDRIVNHASDAIIVAEVNPAEGPGFRIIYSNEAFTRIFGYSSTEVLGKSPRMLQGPGTSLDTIAEISATVHRGISIRRRLLNYTKTRRPVWVDVNIVPLPDHDGSVSRFAAIEREITAEVDREKHLEELAFADPLTKLPNRRYFEDILERELARVRRSGHPLSLALLDIDHFKRVNDTWGHPVGDQVLVAVARSMLHSVRAYDCVARIGGEEFTVLLPGATLADAILIVERIRADIRANAHVITDSQTVAVTCSAGLSSTGNPVDNADDLMAAADQALYYAKEAGRDRLSIGPPFAVDANRSSQRAG